MFGQFLKNTVKNNLPSNINTSEIRRNLENTTANIESQVSGLQGEAVAFANNTKEQIKRQCHSVSFVDDMAFPVFGRCLQILPHTTKMIQILHTHAIMFQLVLNYKVGKTQPMIKLRGEGSVAQKQHI